MDELNKIVDNIAAQNRTPLEDFDGFTSEEMYKIIYDPFSTDCPIHINFEIKNQLFSNIPIFNIVSDLLLLIENNKGLKLTSKGNLPKKVVQKLYDKKYITDELIEHGISKLTSEEKWIVLHTVKIVLKQSKLVRVYNGKLTTLKETKNKLQKNQIGQIFSSFFQAFTTRFNWAYNDGFENEDIGQIGFLYLLYLFNKYGNEYRDIDYYINLYLKAFPIFKLHEKNKKDMIFHGEPERVLKIRFFERFAFWFGLLEIQNKKSNIAFAENIKIKKTAVLSNLIRST